MAAPKSAPPRSDGAGGKDAIVDVVNRADYAIFAKILAEDVVFHSPVYRLRFHGREITSALFERLVKQSDLERWRVQGFWNLGDAHFVALTTNVHGHQLDLLLLTRLNGRFQIREVTAYARPMTSIAIFPAFVFPHLVERFRGRARAAAVRLLFRPLPRILDLLVHAGLGFGRLPQGEFEAELPTPEQPPAAPAGPRSPFRRL